MRLARSLRFKRWKFWPDDGETGFRPDFSTSKESTLRQFPRKSESCFKFCFVRLCHGCAGTAWKKFLFWMEVNHNSVPQTLGFEGPKVAIRSAWRLDLKAWSWWYCIDTKWPIFLRPCPYLEVSLIVPYLPIDWHIPKSSTAYGSWLKLQGTWYWSRELESEALFVWRLHIPL